MKVLYLPKTRRRGPYLYQAGRYGFISRARFIPADPRTLAQLSGRHRLTRLAGPWKALTAAQQYEWTLLAWQQPPRVRSGRVVPLNGFNLFFGINSTRRLLGAPEVILPPPQPVFDPLPVTEFSITNTGGNLALKLAVSAAPAEGTMLWGEPPCSPGRDIARRVNYLGRLPAAVGGDIDVTALYTARFGPPAVATKVFLRINQTRDGWSDVSHQFAAIVPAGA
jgi:hypothetical protein